MQRWMQLGATCFALSATISLAVYILSPKPTDTGDRCLTSDQLKPIKTEQEAAQVKPSGLTLGKKHADTRKAVSPAPALNREQKQADSFDARSKLQVSSRPYFRIINIQLDTSNSTSTVATQNSIQGFHSSFGALCLMKNWLRAALELSMSRCFCEPCHIVHLAANVVA
jgi:hypothetical protein